MLTITTNELPPTLTYSHRSYVWFSLGTGEVVMPNGEVVPALGKLTIKLRQGRRRNCKVELDTYAVDEVEPEQFGTRLFVLLNMTDPEQPEPYRVTVGGMNQCRCMAGKCRNFSGCKHRDAMNDLIAAGDL